MLRRRPGGEMATRPLHFIWMADCSGSMVLDGKIQALNNAIREAVPHMQAVADENPNAQILVRAIKFSSGAQWHIAEPTPVHDFKWVDLQADGVTDMGQALQMVAEQLKVPPMSERGLPPVLVLISDGYPSDDFSSGLRALMTQPWGRAAVRIAIAIGEDAATPEAQDVFQRFIGHNELRPLQANNPEALVRHIKWVSTAVLKSSSAPVNNGSRSVAREGSPSQSNVPVPALSDVATASVKKDDVW